MYKITSTRDFHHDVQSNYYYYYYFVFLFFITIIIIIIINMTLHFVDFWRSNRTIGLY